MTMSLHALKYFLLPACLALGLTTNPAQAESSEQRGDLRVVLHGMGDAGGNVRASLYNDAASFRKEERAVQILAQAAKPGDVELLFKALPYGRYAIMVYHDANADGKLNLRFGMFPSEGYGLSNNPAVVGPPKFADSAFDFAAPQQTVEIKLSY